MDVQTVEAEIAKLIAETSKINACSRLHSFTAGAICFGLMAGLAKLFQ